MISIGELIAKGRGLFATTAQGAKADAALPANADAIADVLEAAATGAPADLARIQASVSGGAAVAVAGAKTLAATDRGVLQQTVATQAFTIGADMPGGWHVPVDGPCTFVSGTGSPAIADRRESGSSYPFCVVSAAPSGYVVTGSKL